MSENLSPTGLHLSDDLLFTSRVAGTAQAHGLSVQAVRTPAVLLERARQAAPRCVLLDLHHPGLDVPALLRDLAEACASRPRIIAYGSHVEAAVLHAARQAGCDVVLPRSQFVEQLPSALPGWLGESGEPRTR